MDIDYLLLLQEFRNSTNNLLTPFMEWISWLSISCWPFIVCACISWAFCKKSGTFLLICSSFGYLVNATFKNTFCVYRPWIRDASIIPAGDSIVTATGYSFPSGHTQAATAYYGGGAWLLFKSKRFWIGTALILMILVTGFSRNYLGVHTPQDVVVALLATFCVIVFNSYILHTIEQHKNGDLLFFGIGIITVIAFLCYITFKPYPMDYIDGKLLVDPEKMQKDCWGAAGAFSGFLVGWIIERRFIKFRTPKKVLSKITWIILGGIPLYFIYNETYGWTVGTIGSSYARFVGMFVPYVYTLAVVPCFIKLFSRKD